MSRSEKSSPGKIISAVVVAVIFIAGLYSLNFGGLRDQLNESSDLVQSAGQDETAVAPKLVVDINKIANKSPAEVEKVLGKPGELETNTRSYGGCDKGIACQDGSYQEKFLITFVKDKAALIRIFPSEPVPFTEDAITAIGLPPMSPESKGAGQMLWRPKGFYDVVYYAPGGMAKNGDFDVHLLPY